MTERQEQDAATSPARPLHVGWFADEDTLGTFARVLGPLAVGLADDLVTITLFRICGAGGDDVFGPGVETVRYRTRRLFGPGAAAVAELAGKVRSGKMDLLHALDASSAGLVAQVAREAGTTYAVSSHATGDGARLGTLGADCAAVLASSATIRKDLIVHHVSAADKVHLFPPGVYHVRTPTCFGETGRSAAVVAGGPMESASPWQSVLRTFAELRLREFDCVFFIMASGRGAHKTHRLARQLDLLGQVTFVDEQVASQFAGIVKAADVYISAAPSGTVNVRTLVALANGSAVLAAEDPTADFIIDGQTALVFDPGNPAELTTKLVAILDDPGAARALAGVALAYVAEHHSPAAAVAALSSIYRSAAAEFDQATRQDRT